MTDADRYARLLAALDAESRRPYFMDRDERRGFARQAGSDWEYADRMIEQMEAFRVETRNAAIAALRERPFDGDFSAFAAGLLAALQAEVDRGGHGHRIGIGLVIAVVKRELPE